MAVMYGVGLHRTTSWTTVIVLLVVYPLFLMSFQEARAQDAGCSHKYTDHLLHNPTCNPYVLGIMKLQCIVEVPVNVTEITIGWFLNCEQLDNDSHVAIEAQVQPASQVRRIRSRLTISDLTDDYAGEYTCNILGDEEYIPSNPFDLKDRDFLEIELALEGPCVDGQVVNPDLNEKCAVITEENPVPMSLVCDAPPATSSQILPSSSTPFILTTSPHLSSSSTPSLTQTTHPTPSDSSVSLPSPTDPGVSTTTASTREDTTSLWLYMVVAVAAVFFMIIVVLAIVPVGMWVVRNKGIDNQRPTRDSSCFITNIPLQPVNDVFEEVRLKLQRRMLFNKDQIHLTRVVGQGESAIVYRATLETLSGRELVAIKTVKALFASSDVTRLIKEINLMATFNHPNVMTLRGVCLDKENPLLVMPFMNNGTVLEYVKKHKESLMLKNEADLLKIPSARTMLLGMCFQVAKGMEYLTKERVVHRDLAARNCMIDVNGMIKVADFGLTEDMYATNYFRKECSKLGNDEKVPIRWMAPESISGELYDEKTDVWSFGVTCWEVFTCGQVPYHGIPVTRLCRVLSTGERLDKPVNSACSDEIFSIISGCWRSDPKERPAFSHLVQEVSSVLEAGADYLDLSLALAGRKNDLEEITIDTSLDRDSQDQPSQNPLAV